jgi:hypothetical protein
VNGATACRGPTIFLLQICALGCASAPPPGKAPAPVAVEKAPPVVPGLAPLTERERQLVDELRKDVEWLALEIGERNLEHEWALASATDDLVGKLESHGHAVERLGVVAGDAVTQNLEVVLAGGKRGTEQIIVGAHYDTHPGTPGADDNATGVAAVLALSRRFRDVKPDRTLRLVLFSNEELPHFQTPSMGRLAYAKRLKEDHATVVAMISLESLGYYTDAAGSQRYPAEVAGRYPTVGNFLGVVGLDSSRDVLDQVATAVTRAASLPVVADALPAEVPGVGWSDHWAFWQVGYPAVMITDTAPFRNPHYHRPTDLPKTLDFERLARAVAAIESAVVELAGVEG